MSSNKSFSTETAERYALALFELSEESSELEKVENEVKSLLDLYKASEGLKNFIKNPTQVNTVQLKVIDEISKVLKFTATFKNFLSILVIKRRFFYLEDIFKRFLSLNSKRRGELKATLTSSKKLSPAEITSLNNQLSSAVGSKIVFDNKVDESLIGGLKVQIGSLMIDSSIKNKLKKYEKLMLDY